jgi:hypothetical protein
LTKQFRVAALLSSLVASLVALAIILSSADSTSAQAELLPETPAPNTVLASLASTAPFSGWLALNGGYAQATYQSELDLPGSMTIEGWIKSPFIGQGYPNYHVIDKPSNYFLQFQYYYHISPPSYYCVEFFIGDVMITPPGNPNCGTSSTFLSGWHYFAYVYDENSAMNLTFWDGNLVLWDGPGSSGPGAATTDLFLRYAEAMDEFRISDVARYSTNFQPPTSPFTCDAHTRALWHFNEITGTTVFHDTCGTVDNMLVGYNGAHTEGVPLVPLTAVTISGPNTGATYASHTFSATVSPITATIPITYTWSPVPDSGQGTAAASYSWLTDGNKTITVTAENIGNIVTDTHTISLDTPVAGVVINGPDTGVVNTTYTFTTTVNPPAATMPISYTWSPEPNSGQGTATVKFSWGITGTQMITVTAENVGGVVSDTQSVDIGEQYSVYLPLIRH